MRRRPAIDKIYEHIWIYESEGSSADKNLTETMIAELMKLNVTVNKKKCLGLDPYYNSSIAKQWIDFTIIDLFLLKAAIPRMIS